MWAAATFSVCTGNLVSVAAVTRLLVCRQPSVQISRGLISFVLSCGDTSLVDPSEKKKFLLPAGRAGRSREGQRGAVWQNLRRRFYNGSDPPWLLAPVKRGRASTPWCFYTPQVATGAYTSAAADGRHQFVSQLRTKKTPSTARTGATWLDQSHSFTGPS